MAYIAARALSKSARGDSGTANRAGATGLCRIRSVASASSAQDAERKVHMVASTSRRALLGALSPFERAVVRVARSVADIVRVRTEGYAELPHQRAALDKAVAEMEALRPGVKRDLQNVFNADRTTIDEAASGRPQRTIRATMLEAEMRADPARRADQFVARWSKLQKQSDRAYAVGDIVGRKAIQSEMAGMAKSLERDPQMESILARRKAQLGITIDTGRRLGAELAFNHGIDFGRGRGLGR